MVITAAAITATETALAAAGKPMLVASNALENAYTTPIWSSATTALATDTDITDPLMPTRRLFDRFIHVRTSPRIVGYGGGLYRYWLVGSFNISSVFDSIFILGHNFASMCSTGNALAGAYGVSIDLADDAAFSVNLRSGIASYQGPKTGPGSTRRISFLNLGGAETRYTVAGLGYWRLRLGNASALDTTALNAYPAVSEIIFGRRRQFERRPMIPYDDYSMESDIGQFRSKSSVTSLYTRSAGGRLVRAVFAPDSAYDVGAVQSWFADTGYGANKTIWVEDPSATFPAAYWCVPPMGLGMPLEGPFERRVEFEMREDSPFLSGEA